MATAEALDEMVRDREDVESPRDIEHDREAIRSNGRLGKILFLGLGVAAGAGAALAIYRRPIDTALALWRLKLWAKGFRSLERLTAGTRIRYFRGGDPSATAIVFVHGPHGASESWHHVMPRVSRSFHVIAPDLPGFGRSPDPVDASVGFLGRALGSLLSDEGVESVVLVGSSLGGMVALETAVRYPALVRGLVLSDVLGVCGDMPDRSLFTHAGRADVDELLRKLFCAVPALPPFVRDDMVARSQRPSIPALLRRIPEESRALEARLPELCVPTLLMWGDADGLSPIESGERLNGLIQGSRLIRIFNCGHLPHVEAPDVFHEVLMDFLAGPTPEPPDGYDL